MRIEICGGIACGKTTVAEILYKHCRLSKIKEEYNNNPFLRRFYREPKRYSFETEIAFLLIHYHQVKTQCLNRSSIVCDYSFLLDRAFADVTLDSEQRRAFSAVYRQVISEIGQPTILVYLSCAVNIQLERIRARSRMIERNIRKIYLNSVNESLNKHVNTISSQVTIIHVDTGTSDLIRDRAARNDLISRVKIALR